MEERLKEQEDEEEWEKEAEGMFRCLKLKDVGLVMDE